MDATDLCFTPATELAAMIRRRTLSPVTIMDAVLARIEALNPRLKPTSRWMLSGLERRPRRLRQR